MKNRAKKISLLFSSAFFSALASAEVGLDEANRAFANPLTQSTLFIVENNYFSFEGDAVDGTEHANVLLFDPLIPQQLGDSDWNLVHRPVLPVISSLDTPIGNGETRSDSGIGDLLYFGAFTPKSDSKFSWGAGPVVVLPTATDDHLGSEKYSLGGVLIGVYAGDKFTVGALNQNYWSVAGESDRESVNISTLQYFLFYNFTPNWGFGTAPIIQHDWKRDETNIPIGVGLTYTFKIGNYPTRLLFEYQKYIENGDDYAPEDNFRIALGVFLPKIGG